MTDRDPLDVIPPALAAAIEDLPDWFLIGGQAVRCVRPYRPSRDVDLGVPTRAALRALVGRLGRRGKPDFLERGADTVHLRFDGIEVSIFVLEVFAPFVEGRRLSTTGILASKVHAIVDRGFRRDFTDLYVMLQVHSLGIGACLAAVRSVFGTGIEEGLLLRSLTYFEDADREAALPGEGPRDWSTVKEFFRTRVGHLLLPPPRALAMQERVVDARGTGEATPAAAPPRRPRRPPRR